MHARHLLLFAALLAPVSALANNAADEADLAFSLGNQSFLKRDYEHALTSYFLSYRLAPNANVLFNIARCYEALDRLDEAYRYYFDLSVSEGLPDDDRKRIEQGLARLAPKVALVQVTSEPPGAEVFVDREDLGSRGRTPLTLAIPPGAHRITSRLKGYRPGAAQVTTVRGRAEKAHLALERILGRIELSGSPAGAVVRESAEGPELAKLPATLSFPPGQKLLFVDAPGHRAAQLLVEIKADALAEARVELVEQAKLTGKVVVTANRENAVVHVDGREAGFTPVVLSLGTGRHVVEVSADEVVPERRELTIEADTEIRLHAELRYAPPPVRAASKSQMSIDQAPASVTVITREEIRAFGYQTLPEALQGVRGLFFTDDRIYTYIGLRGFSPAGDFNNRILVLWDGHPMNDAWVGQGFAARDLAVDLGEVDRIEVVRGPASTLFGTGAVFGVINVVPRDSLPGSRVAEGTLGAGGMGGVKGRVSAGAGEGRRSVLVSGAGLDATGAAVTELPGRGTVNGLDGERVLGASMRASWDGFKLAARINNRSKDLPTAPPPSALALPGTNYLDRSGFVEGRWEQEFGRFLLAARASYDGYRFVGTFTETAGSSQEIGKADWLTAEARTMITLFDGNRLSLTLEGQHQLVEQRYSADAEGELESLQRSLLSAALIDEWQIHPRVFLQAGLRADQYFDLESVALSPRGALVLKPYGAGLTKLVAGRAFRAPTNYEQFVNSNSVQPPSGGLAPEYITTFELEHSHNLTPEVRLTFGGYHNLVDGLIGMVDHSPVGVDCSTTQCFAYENSGARLTATGAEAQLRWQPGRFTLVDASYSFVVLGGDGKDAASGYPAHLASLRGMLPLREGFVRLSGAVTYQSSRRDPQSGARLGESLLADAGLSGEYGSLRYFAGVRNLLDEVALLPVASEVGFETVPQYGRTLCIEVGAGF